MLHLDEYCERAARDEKGASKDPKKSWRSMIDRLRRHVTCVVNDAPAVQSQTP
jgi:hypothetical protein